MSTAVEKLFTGRPVLCDGAMGTMLYSCGVFINRCYDELNVTQPETVRSVHEQYLLAGAEVLETNTFGANSFRLEHFGLRDKVREFNLAGVALARQCVAANFEKHATEAFVAGAVGSLGVQLEPKGTVSLEAAREAFAEQISALAEGGVDLLVLETMMSLDEAEQAIAAAREVAPQLKVVALVTVNEEAICLDGSTPEQAARRLTAAGADAIGCNCSVGPATVLTVIERMRPETTLPLVAMPNAGMPRIVEGRNIYLTSPEYIARFARKFLKAGATWVGGCCGTTPAHIRAMRSEIRAMQAQDEGESSAMRVSVSAPAAELEVEPKPLGERSEVGRRIAAGEFVHLVEIVPPKGFDCTRELAGAALLASRGVHAINVPDSPRASARMSAQSLCVQIQQKIGIETVLHYTCRDRNILSIQSDLLGASSIGLKNILCLTGDPPKMGNYPDATAVFDVDAIGLVRIVRGLNHGLDIGRNPVGGSAGFTISVAANPGVPDIEHEVRRFAAKVEAGAEFCITQPVFDQRLLEQFLRRVEAFRIPIVAGIWPLTSLRNAEFMKNDLRVSMPDTILARMAAAPNKQSAQAEGLAIAQEMLAEVKGAVQGVQVSAPFANFAAAAEVLGLREEATLGA
ncbi:MAG TPA: bifunctional homocysteine S-methyltransferase/methylenetetrahydrofolate reductase [Acidobacteriaceae bacterium]|jgi:homocysteine S-methyltransferase|nr:bifunctional homocysteine S-methyltransferase/methylenetetrahydrofolate reductase [Acidobacteriaceae bacterium]